MTVMKRARLMTMDSRTSFIYIPDDLVFEILVRLPAECLLRFKTVCKNWRTMIEQEYFVLSHDDDRAPIVPFIPDDNHSVVAYCGGTVLEQNLSSEKLRVRNPCLRLVLDLPDPSKTSSMIDFAQFKLVSFYDDEEGNKGCQVLTFNEDNLSWKTVPAPPEFSNKNLKVFHSRRYGDWVVRYFWTDTNDESSSGRNFKIGVESFDAKSGLFGTSTTFLYPPDFFRSFLKVEAMRWNDRLVVCAIDNNDKEKLHATVLDDLETQRWSDRKTFSLRFMGNNLPLSPVKVSEHDGYIFFRSSHRDDVEVKDKRMIRPRYCFNLRHSLMAFKGMQPEAKKIHDNH